MELRLLIPEHLQANLYTFDDLHDENILIAPLNPIFYYKNKEKVFINQHSLHWRVNQNIFVIKSNKEFQISLAVVTDHYKTVSDSCIFF